MQKSDMQVVMGLYQVLKKFQYVDMYLTSIVLLLNCNGMTNLSTSKTAATYAYLV